MKCRGLDSRGVYGLDLELCRRVLIVSREEILRCIGRYFESYSKFL